MQNEFGIFIGEDDEELVCRQLSKLQLPAGFEISVEDAEERIVFCKRCKCKHKWLECKNPIVN